MHFNYFYIVIFLASIVAQNTIDIDQVDHIFYIISVEVEETTIKLFNTLKLPPNFTDSELFQKDLDMYTYLKTTSNINHKTFRNIADISAITPDNNNSQIDNVINEIINGSINLENAQDTINEVFHYFIPLITRKSEDSDELSLEFIKEFIDKLNETELKQPRDNSKEIKLDNGVICHMSEEFANKTWCESNKPNETFENVTKTQFEMNEKDLTNETFDKLEESVNNYAINNSNSTAPSRNKRMQAWDPKVDCVNYYHPSRRIYKGLETSIRNYSFMVSVHDNGIFVCVGTIIRRNLVISAASCLERIYLDDQHKTSVTSVNIRIGSDFVYTGGLLAHASHIIFHPEFDPVSFTNNLVLLHINKGELAMIKWVKRLKYKKQESIFGDVIAGKDHVKILGWGQQTIQFDQQTQSFSNKMPLSYEHLDVFSLEMCRNIYSELYVSDNNFCAGFVLKGGACKNDIGGPGIRHGILVGIVSFGPTHCGAADHPTVFTRITPYVEWIHGVVRDVLPKIRHQNVDFFYNESWDSRRIASYVHKIPTLDTFRKYKTIIKLKDQKKTDSRKQIKPVQFQENLNQNPYLYLLHKIRKSKLPETNYLSTLEVSSKIPEPLHKSIATVNALNRTEKTTITPTTNNKTGQEVIDKIYLVDEQGANAREEKDLDEGIVIRYNDPILDYRPDISISHEYPNETIDVTNKNLIERKFSLTESKLNENLNETLKTLKDLNQKFLFYQRFSPDERKRGDESIKSNEFIIAPQNQASTQETSRTTGIEKLTTSISDYIQDAKKQKPNSDLQFVVMPNLATDYNLYDKEVALYEDDYQNELPIQDNNTIHYNSSHSNLNQSLLQVDNYDSNYDGNDSSITENDDQSYEDEDYSDEGGLSLDTPKGQSVVTEYPMTVTTYGNISIYVTAFNTNTPKKIRFEAIKKRDFR